MSSKVTEHNMDQLLDKVKSSVDSEGIAVMAINCEFAYSIGASAKGLPDMIISCPDPHQSHLTLTALYKLWLEAGYQEGRVLGAIVGSDDQEDLPLYVKPIAITKALVDLHVTQAVNFYMAFPECLSPAGIRFVQVYWPDKNGLFPFDEGYDHCEQVDFNTLAPSHNPKDVH